MISGVDSGVSIFTRMTALAERSGAINLGQGFPDFDGPTAVIEAAVDALRAGHNQYPPLQGVARLRDAIAAHQARRYGIVLDPDREIQVTFGATEAIAAALLALVGPGDGRRSGTQWRKWRTAVVTIATPAASAAAMTSASRIEPPGWMTARTPASKAIWGPSAKGK
jgi:N-succinyldiaminopimelate aminotransferase